MCEVPLGLGRSSIIATGNTGHRYAHGLLWLPVPVTELHGALLQQQPGAVHFEINMVHRIHNIRYYRLFDRKVKV